MHRINSVKKIRTIMSEEGMIDILKYYTTYCIFLPHPHEAIAEVENFCVLFPLKY